MAPETTGADPADLAVALSQPGPSEALVVVEESLGEAASVTGRVERSLELFTAVAQGRVDRKVVLQEVDVLLGALERLDREGGTTMSFASPEPWPASWRSSCAGWRSSRLSGWR